MAKGNAFLLKFSDGKEPPTYSTVAGLRVNSASVEAGKVDYSAGGIFLGSDAEAEARGYVLAGTIVDCELSFEDGHRERAPFLIQRIDYTGHFNGEPNYTIRLVSAGDVQMIGRAA